MRKIKFRIWDKNGFFMDNSPCGASLWEGNLICDDEYILMQYVGVNSDNGVCIFEGDVIKCQRRIDSPSVLGGHLKIFIGEVVFCCGCYVLSGVKQYKGRIVDIATALDREIIGNIYQNPELLEQ